MKPLSSGLRLRSLAALLGLSCSASLLPVASHEQPRESPLDQSKQADLTKRKTPFVPLQVVGSRTNKNVVEVTLTVAMKIHEIDSDTAGGQKHRIRTRSYNCSLCGPVIRVKPGDQLTIRLTNDIKRTEPDTEYDPNNHTAPHGFNVTNLHTHGLNVSPSGRSDNVFLEVGPEEYLDLCFDIPEDHVCGTMWYHAHKHGSVALQLAGGMAGVLIVEGGKGSLDEDPAIRAATAKEHEKILVFQQIPYRPAPDGKVVEVLPADVYAAPMEKNKRVKANELKRRTLINGEWYPTITMRPGEVQRWRCVHGGLEETLDLALVKTGKDGLPLDFHDKSNRVPLHEIAVDGLPLGTLETWHGKPVELQPGYRSDLLVKAPPPGEYVLMSLPVQEVRAFSGIPQDEIKLARIVVRGAALNPEMKLPEAKDLEKYPGQQGLKPIKTIDNTRTIEFFSNDKLKRYLVNCELFTMDRILFSPKLGDAEEWTLSPAAGRHPFHVHVNPFLVGRENEEGKLKKIWRDTVVINAELTGNIQIQMRFNKFTGKTVLHCHNLRHEDQGMMAAFRIVGKDEVEARCPKVKAGFDKLPTEAPDWELPGAKGKTHRWSDYKGKQKLLLVFSRGSECVHCRAQIQALSKKVKELANAGLAVIVVSPVAPEKLPGKNGFPFVALSDEEWAVFKDYRCHDGRALHGSFLISSKGRVQWQDAGDEPFMDVEALLKEAGKLE